MRGKSVLLLVIALVCGAIASVGLTQMLNKPAAQATKVASVKVYVALDDIDINEELTADNMKLEEWPKDRVPEGAITKLTSAEGKYAMHRLFKGEPLLKRKISEKRIGTEEKIPEGYRAVAVRTSAQSAVSNLLLPGTRVDVISYFKQGNGIPQTQTRTILKDVRVFSVNAHTTRDTEGKSKASIDAKTVTLLVKPSQVQLLMLASQLGTLQFAMRKPDDVTDQETDPTTTRQLLGDAGEGDDRLNDQPQITAPAAEEPSDFLSFINKTATPPAAKPASLAPTAEMVVMTPHGAPRKFQWHGNEEYPQEVSFAGPPTGFPTLPTSVIPGLNIPPSGEQPAAHSPKDSSEGEGNAEGDDSGE